MSVAELVIHVRKQEGSALGFTLVKDSCTVHRIIDKQCVGDLMPGDVIMCINDIEVSDESIREVLRSCRHLSEVILTVARGPGRPTSTDMPQPVGDNRPVFGIAESPIKNQRGCFCFSRRKNLHNMQVGAGNRPSLARRQASLVGSDCSPRPQFGSVSSMSSAGVRPVDLRKLHKEGAGTMWMVSRGNSIR
jgi:hypothetical protein